MKTRVEMRNCVYCLNNDVKYVGIAEYELSRLRIFYGVCLDCSSNWRKPEWGVHVKTSELISLEEAKVRLVKEEL